MNYIFNQLPAIRLRYFPGGWPCTINTRLDKLPTDSLQLLSLLTNRFLKEKDFWDFDSIEEKRALKNLRKLTRSIEYRKGTCFLSVFLYSYSKRLKKIVTSIENNVDSPEFMNAPENIDYNQDFVINDIDFSKSLWQGVISDCIFAVEHKNRSEEPKVRCDTCNGTGAIKCPQCGGTGRGEAYEADTYASGQSRMVTGRCPECGGTGRVFCPDCNGTGSIDIFVPQYSVVRSVEDVLSKSMHAFATLPGEETQRALGTNSRLDDDLNWRPDNYHEFWDTKEKLMHSSIFAFRKKNYKEVLEDNQEDIKLLMQKNRLGDLYEKHLNWADSSIAHDISERGNLVSRQESHYCFPCIVLKLKLVEGETVKFVLYEQEGVVSVHMDGLPAYSSGELLQAKIKTLFKK